MRGDSAAMILTCPNCSTRYFADASTLGDAGRPVRCAACGKTWHATRAHTDEADAAPAAAPTPDPMDVLADLDSEPTSKTKPHVAIRERAARVRQRTRTMAAAAAWAAICGVFAAGLGVAYLFRVDVVRAWPNAASAYAFFGVEANARGLSFVDTSAQTTFEGGRAILVVASTVRNTTGQVRPIPYVRVSLRDGDAQTLYDWVVAIETPELGPQEETRFTALLARPPAEARDLELRFVDDPGADGVDAMGETDGAESIGASDAGGAASSHDAGDHDADGAHH